MPSVPCRNDFVTKLRSLQQDGKEAISSPSNWSDPPLLDVSTDDETQLRQMLENLAPSGVPTQAQTGRWHWLIGSPGNGKSAKLGRIVRKLQERGCRIVDQDEIDLTEMAHRRLPYLLKVYQPDAKYPFAYLVQDASVVRLPFAEKCDPAEDLAEVLEEAWQRGVSLVVCTNWGVIERLFERGHIDTSINQKPWFSSVKDSFKKSSTGNTVHSCSNKHAVFTECIVTYEFLDARSLLVNSQIFSGLIENAISPKHWSNCTDCDSQDKCPFKANRDSLASEKGRQSLLTILRRAEVISGQIIVFREANALISLLLSGCPSDQGEGLPCDWVHGRVKEHDLFALLARRIQSILFGGTAALGLERSRLKGDQVKAIRGVLAYLELSEPDAYRALSHIVSNPVVSSDLGIVRLLGVGGVLSELDPALDPRLAARLEGAVDVVQVALDSTTLSLEGEIAFAVGKVERACGDVWNAIARALEFYADPVQGHEIQFWISRWRSTHVGWITAYAAGYTKMGEEADQYLRFLDRSDAGAAQLLRLRELSNVLQKLLFLDASEQGQVSIKLAAGMALTGQWAQSHLRPQLEQEAHQGGGNSLVVKLTNGTKLRFHLPASTFILLVRKHDLHLSDITFPGDLLEVFRRLLAQAAASSKYSIADDDVEIEISPLTGKVHRFVRIQGEILNLSAEGRHA